jgi:hypothetical protein
MFHVEQVLWFVRLAERIKPTIEAEMPKKTGELPQE